MGNCLRKNQISSSQDEDDEQVKRLGKGGMVLNCGPQSQQRDNPTSGGATRIRLVVTKEELKRVLNNKNNEDGDSQHISLDQLLKEMKFREKSVSKIEESDDDGSLNSWRPALQSIPEDRSFKYSS